MDTSRTSPFPPRVSDYQLLVPIGRGGMGRVFLAEREVAPGVRREFAVKLIEGEEETDALEKLRREVSLAARIRHANVVSTLDAGIDDGQIYVCMEYVEGDSLAALLRECQRKNETLPLPIAGRILCDALTGLHAAHQATNDDGEILGLVHRDFTPQNLLVGVDGVTRLTDFGIATAMALTSKTKSGVLKGKVAYVSPEQAIGKAVDARTDVWAAGVVIWETLAGKRLFDRESDAVTLMAIVSGMTPPALSKIRSDVPAALDDLIQGALQTDVGARIRSAEQLRRRLMAALGELAEPVDVARHVSRARASELAERRERAKRARLVEKPVARSGRRVGGAIGIVAAAAVVGTLAWPDPEAGTLESLALPTPEIPARSEPSAAPSNVAPAPSAQPPKVRRPPSSAPGIVRDPYGSP